MPPPPPAITTAPPVIMRRSIRLPRIRRGIGDATTLRQPRPTSSTICHPCSCISRLAR